MSFSSTPTDITLPQPAETAADDFAAGSEVAQALLDHMREGTADPDELFRMVILAVHAGQAHGLCNTVQEVLKTFGIGAAEAQILKKQFAVALTIIVALKATLEAAQAYVNETDAERRALLEKADAVLEDVRAAVPRKLLKVERAVEFVFNDDGEIIGAATVLTNGNPQPSA